MQTMTHEQPPFTFDAYSAKAGSTATYPPEYALAYPLLGLLGEAGEILRAVKLATIASGAVNHGTSGLALLLADVGGNLGEVEVAKKQARKGQLDSIDAAFLQRLAVALSTARPKILDEGGDALWYIDRLAADAGASLAAVAELNNAKLAARREAGTVKDEAKRAELAGGPSLDWLKAALKGLPASAYLELLPLVAEEACKADAFLPGGASACVAVREKLFGKDRKFDGCIVVSGGVVQTVYGPDNFKMVLIDYDNIEEGVDTAGPVPVETLDNLHGSLGRDNKDAAQLRKDGVLPA